MEAPIFPDTELLEPRRLLTDVVFATQVAYPANASPQNLVVADFNHDSRADLAVTNFTDGTVSILRGNGKGGFTAPTAYDAGGNLSGIAAGDLNGDGKIDLVASGDQV